MGERFRACGQSWKSIYRGSAEARHEVGTIDGRADRDQLAVADLGGAAFTAVYRAASTVIRAVSSRSVGSPRTTLTSGSAFIDRAYDDTAESW